MRKGDEASVFAKFSSWASGRVQLPEVAKTAGIAHFRAWAYDILNLKCLGGEIAYAKYDNSCRSEIIFTKLEQVWHIFQSFFAQESVICRFMSGKMRNIDFGSCSDKKKKFNHISQVEKRVVYVVWSMVQDSGLKALLGSGVGHPNMSHKVLLIISN